MMKNRRDFIRTTSIAAAGSMLLPGVAQGIRNDVSGNKGNKTIGLQIYTLRNKLNEDLRGTLEKVAETGYQTIEAFGYSQGKLLGVSPKDLARMTEDLGMKLISSHMHIERITKEDKKKVTDDWKRMVEDYHDAGVDYLVNAGIAAPFRKNIDDYKKWAESFNSFGELCKNAGISFGYHNHSFEFEPMEGHSGYEVLLEETEPELMFFEPDVYWMELAGADPVAYFKRYPERFPLWHVQDMEEGPDKAFAEVGHGIINFRRIFTAREAAGLKYIFVEQGRCKRDEFESIKMSFDYLQSADFV